MRKIVLAQVLGLLCASGAFAATAPANPAPHDQKNTIRLLQFDLRGAGCSGRHCELTLSNNDGLKPVPAVRVPGDRLYVRVFDDTLADLTKPVHVPEGHCVTYSTVRVELSNGDTDPKNIIFGVKMREVLFDFAKLSGFASQTRTVVLVFETESGDETVNSTTVLRLSREDVPRYFQYAIEIKYTLKPHDFSTLQSQMVQPGAFTSGPGVAEEAQSQRTGSSLSSYLAAFVAFFVPAVHAASPPPPPAAPVDGAGSLSTEQIQVLLYPHCDAVGPYVPAHAAYTLASLKPAAELEPTPCGE